MSERLQGHRTKSNANKLKYMGSDVDAVTKSGRLFHTRAAATGKARSPTVDSQGNCSKGVCCCDVCLFVCISLSTSTSPALHVRSSPNFCAYT